MLRFVRLSPKRWLCAPQLMHLRLKSNNAKLRKKRTAAAKQKKRMNRQSMKRVRKQELQSRRSQQSQPTATQSSQQHFQQQNPDHNSSAFGLFEEEVITHAKKRETYDSFVTETQNAIHEFEALASHLDHTDFRPQPFMVKLTKAGISHSHYWIGVQQPSLAEKLGVEPNQQNNAPSTESDQEIPSLKLEDFLELYYELWPDMCSTETVLFTESNIQNEKLMKTQFMLELYQRCGNGFQPNILDNNLLEQRLEMFLKTFEKENVFDLFGFQQNKNAYFYFCNQTDARLFLEGHIDLYSKLHVVCERMQFPSDYLRARWNGLCFGDRHKAWWKKIQPYLDYKPIVCVTNIGHWQFPQADENRLGFSLETLFKNDGWEPQKIEAILSHDTKELWKNRNVDEYQPLKIGIRNHVRSFVELNSTVVQLVGGKLSKP